MGIFKVLGNLFEGDNKTESVLNWKAISVGEEIENILAVSNEKPQVLYKHSTRCATSYFALKSLQNISDIKREKAEFYMIDVISQRELSFYIADKLGIRHESPQLIILNKGEVTWHGSHQLVQADSVHSNL